MATRDKEKALNKLEPDKAVVRELERAVDGIDDQTLLLQEIHSAVSNIDIHVPNSFDVTVLNPAEPVDIKFPEVQKVEVVNQQKIDIPAPVVNVQPPEVNVEAPIINIPENIKAEITNFPEVTDKEVQKVFLVDDKGKPADIKPIINMPQPSPFQYGGRGQQESIKISGTVPVNIVGGSSSGTEYAEGSTEATITGTALMWEDTSDTLRSVSATKPLPIQPYALNGGGVLRGITSDSNGYLNVNMAHQSDIFDNLVTGQRENQVELNFFEDTTAASYNGLANESLSGGATITDNSGQLRINSGTATTASATLITVGTMKYRAMHELYISFTAAWDTNTANSTQLIGGFDTTDGFAVGYNGTSFGILYRNDSSDVFITSFNKDLLDGSAGSVYTSEGSPVAFDKTKVNVFRIRFGWLGSAPAIFEIMSPDGDWVIFHIIRQPNLQNTPSITNPNLPIRAEVTKTSADATDLVMRTHCWAAGSTSELAPLAEPLTDDSLAKKVRAILTAQKPDQTYVNIDATAGGNLKFSMEETEPGAGNISKQEDTAHTTGDQGVNLLVVRKDTATQLADTDGDYSPLINDANGRLHTFEKNSDAILTDTNTLAGAVSASKVQVDVITQPNIKVGGLDVSDTNPVPVAAEKATTSTTSTGVSVGSGSTTVLASNANRKAAIIVNDSDEVVYLNYSGTAVMNQGIRVNANGGVVREETYTGIITGICSSGSKNVTVTEL